MSGGNRSLKNYKPVDSSLPTFFQVYKWTAPKVHKKWAWLYTPLAVMVVASGAFGWFVQELKDEKQFQKPWGLQLAVFAWLTILVMAVTGLIPEVKRYEDARKILFSIRLIGELLLSSVTIPQKTTVPAKQKYIQVATLELTNFNGVTYEKKEQKNKLITFNEAIEHALKLILLCVTAFMWELTSKNPTTDEGREIIDRMKGMPSYGFILSNWESPIIGAGNQLLCMNILDRFQNALISLMDNELLNRSDGNGNSMIVLLGALKNLKEEIDLFRTRERTRLIIFSMPVFLLFSYLTLIATPFLILSVTGSHLWYIYPAIVLIIGYFILLRWFIGDIFHNAADIYASHLNQEIYFLLRRITSQYASLVTDPIDTATFESTIVPYFNTQ